MKKYLIFLTACFFLSAHSAHALTISPPTKEFGADPGSTIKGIIKLYNETKQEIIVYGSTSNFTAKASGDGESEFLDLGGQEAARDLASWIKVPEGGINIKPLDWQNIIFEINVPSDAEPGGHYAAIFFSPNQTGNKKEVSVDYKTGSLLLLSVTGNVRQEGKLKSLLLRDGKYLFEHIPVTLEAMIENTGNVHFRPGGGVEIKNMFGHKVADLPVLNTETGGNILPKSSRKYDMTWGNVADNLSGNFWNEAKFEWNNFHFGRYTAVAVIGLPQGQGEAITVSFWIIPWQLLVVILAGIIALWFVFRTYNRWIIRKARSGK